jgi:8-oxo-dGTP diphosphatase
MNVATSEFACQELEIDFPVVVFGGDYYVMDGKFTFDSKKLKYHIEKYKNPETIIESIYRVLLTRSRKGMIIFVPNEKILDEAYEFFRSIGIEKI